MKTETGEIISKKEAVVREAMACGFQRFEAEAFYNNLRRLKERLLKQERNEIADMIDPWLAYEYVEKVRNRGQA
jgi:hypothetical protein